MDVNSERIQESSTSTALPTRWLFFYIYFFLPFKIITSFVPTLAMYDELIEAGYDINLNPFDFAPIIIFDIFICFVFYGLHKRKLWGWICNWIFLVSFVLLSPFNINKDFGVYIVAVIILSLIFLLPNYIYFRKRKALFDK